MDAGGRLEKRRAVANAVSIEPGMCENSHASYRPTRRSSKPLPVIRHPLHGHQGGREAPRIVDLESAFVKLLKEARCLVSKCGALRTPIG